MNVNPLSPDKLVDDEISVTSATTGISSAATGQVSIALLTNPLKQPHAPPMLTDKEASIWSTKTVFDVNQIQSFEI